MESTQVYLQGLLWLQIRRYSYCLRIYILLPRVANFLPEVLCLLRYYLSPFTSLNQLWSLGSLDLPHPLPLVEREVLLLFWKYWFTVVNYVFLLYFFFFIDAPIYPYSNKKQRPLAKCFVKRQKCSSRKKRDTFKDNQKYLIQLFKNPVS